MAKYKIEVIKLLMGNGKLAEYGTLHDEAAFSRPVSDLEKEKFIVKASKADLEAEKVALKASEKASEKSTKEEEEDPETK